MKQPNQTAPVIRPKLFSLNIPFDQWNSGLTVLPIDDPSRYEAMPGVIGCHVLSPWSRTDCL